MRLLVLGSGSMAEHHAKCFGEMEDVQLVGAVDLDPKRLAVFADRFSLDQRFTSLEEALDWGRFDAVANVTPDAVHHSTTMACIGAGKHVFCEKPIAPDHKLGVEMTEAAEQAGSVGMINLVYRAVAPLQRAREMVQAGDIGEVKHVEASYLQSWLSQPLWGDWRDDPRWLWRLSTKHGSTGALGDIGIHVLDFACFGADLDIAAVQCRLHTFPKAEGDRIGDYQLDANDSFVMSASFDNGALGSIHASRWASGHINELRLRIYGDKGALEVVNLAGADKLRDPRVWSLRVCLGKDLTKGTWKKVTLTPIPFVYDRFVDAVRQGETGEPSFRTATRLQQVLDVSADSDKEGCFLPVNYNLARA